MADLPFPPAPPATDDQSVILWVIGTLVVVLVIAVIQLWRVMVRNQVECREENTRAWSRCDEQTAKVETLLTGALAETQRLAQTAIEESRQNRAALDRNTDVIRGIESGKYRTRDR